MCKKTSTMFLLPDFFNWGEEPI